MFNKIFGTPPAEPIPDNLRQTLEEELLEFCYLFNLSFGYSVIVSKQNRLDANTTLLKIEPLSGRAQASVENIQKLWPSSNTIIADLSKMAEILPHWLSNFRSWQMLIHDIEAGRLGEIDKERYQRHVIKNREYTSQLDESFQKAKKHFRKLGINLDLLDEKSKEKVISDLAQDYK